jgi:hypothetical protein
MTVVDVLSQRLEIEQETCKRQCDAINELRLELSVFKGAQVRFLSFLHMNNASSCMRWVAAQGRAAAGACGAFCCKMPIADAFNIRSVSVFISFISVCLVFGFLLKASSHFNHVSSNALLERRRGSGAAQARANQSSSFTHN